MLKTLFVFGTRPEAIKLAPVIEEFRKHRDRFEMKVCLTAQHRQMLDQVVDFFSIPVDYDLDLMRDNQSLSELAANCLIGLNQVLMTFKPDIIFVQGDTTSSFIGALAGYFHHIKVAHIEAGLRSGDKFSPFPEEINRILTGHIADYHFAPTETAKENLIREGIRENIMVVGNTVVDALMEAMKRIQEQDPEIYRKFFHFVDFSKKLILITGHRRESFGEPFKNICRAIKEIALKHNDVEVIYPVHLNPNVSKPVNAILSGIDRIHLIDPVDYPHLIWLMSNCYLVLTDSGGIQEEAPTLKKPVLIMRNHTERTEGIASGSARLVGTFTHEIVEAANDLLTNNVHYLEMTKSPNPYGDGLASGRIARFFLDIHDEKNCIP
ncbi:MAG: UDP-N-acetylglucosamine 2-epimerase (non-hydrolyzing) [Bacteroidetes bacterium]|nr:UDP-N-acetylglucosamine 2-epimerase (non-hydrolyzing) [Bacteroidota bacterium]